MLTFFTTTFDANASGYFGPYGGRYVPEALIPALDELAHEYRAVLHDHVFVQEFEHLLDTFVGRPSPLTFAANLTRRLGGAQIYLKNEGCNLTGAHKINHCVGQGLIAKRLGKTTLIAETGAGQHGVATATVAAKIGMKCVVFMGEVDMHRQMPNVDIMKMLGATVISVTDGSRTLKDAVNAAIKHWIAHTSDSHYVLGSCLGPHPYPSMNRDFQSITGFEIAAQMHNAMGRLPDIVMACVGGGSNAMGAFNRFLDEPSVRLIGVEAAGEGVEKGGKHASRLTGAPEARPGILHGYRSVFLQTADGGIDATHSISAGLDYPGVGPQLAYLHECKRAEFVSVTDAEAVSALRTLAREEGIIPALESSHAVAHGLKLAPTVSSSTTMVIHLSGRADKDLHRLEVVSTL